MIIYLIFTVNSYKVDDWIPVMTFNLFDYSCCTWLFMIKSDGTDWI